MLLAKSDKVMRREGKFVEAGNLGVSNGQTMLRARREEFQNSSARAAVGKAWTQVFDKLAMLE